MSLDMRTLPKSVVFLGALVLGASQSYVRANDVPALSAWTLTQGSENGDAFYSTVLELGPTQGGVVIFNGGDTNAGGSASDSFATTDGDEYSVTFGYSTMTDTTQFLQTLDYSAAGASGSVQGPLIPVIDGPNYTPIGAYTPSYFSFDFTADSSTTTLAFTDPVSNSSITYGEDGDLYNVSVTPVAAPDGGMTALLLGLGFAGLGLSRLGWRRRAIA